jgi:adenylate cyclase class 2
MGLEVELKYRADDAAAVRHKIEALGGRPVGIEHHEDGYFNAPHRDFRTTDEALRVRTTDALAWITYKGPKLDPLSKTRMEIEAPIDLKAAGAVREIFASLGFQAVRTVKKTRTLYFLSWQEWPTTLSVDEVEGLPTHVELEIHAPTERMTAARDALLELAERLDLKNAERRSYLEMLLGAPP